MLLIPKWWPSPPSASHCTCSLAHTFRGRVKGDAPICAHREIRGHENVCGFIPLKSILANKHTSTHTRHTYKQLHKHKHTQISVSQTNRGPCYKSSDRRRPVTRSSLLSTAGPPEAINLVRRDKVVQMLWNMERL